MDTCVGSARPLEQLEAMIFQGAANLTAAEHDWLLDVAEFAQLSPLINANRSTVGVVG